MIYMYHITIRASTVENNNFLETEKTFTVTVTKNPDDDGGFHITTASSGFLVTVTVRVFSAVSLPLVALILTR
jgi:hypothetical protein